MHAGFIRNVIEDVLYIDVYRKGKCSFFLILLRYV